MAMPDCLPPLLVFPDKYALGWRGDIGPVGPRRPDKTDPQKYDLDSDGKAICELTEVDDSPIEALRRDYTTDAHCAMYYVDGETWLPRITKKGVAGGHIEARLGWIIVDVDTPDHVPLEEAPLDWLEGVIEAEESIPELAHALRWSSRGGYKYAWPLAEDRRYRVEKAEDYLHQFVQYLIEGGLLVDENATDWTRLMRMPRTVRDGAFQDYEINGLDGLAPLDWSPPREPVADRSQRKKARKAASGVDELQVRAREALGFVDPDCAYDRWFAVGTALKITFGEKGFPIWRDWSKRADDPDSDAALRDKWGQLPEEATDDGITLRSIFHYAREGGWSDRMSIEEAEAVLHDAFTPDDYFDDRTLQAAARLMADNGAAWAKTVERAKGSGGPGRFSDWERAVRDKKKEIASARKVAEAQIKRIEREATGGLVSNFERDYDVEGNEIRLKKGIAEIVEDVFEATGDWPRLMDNVAFAPDPGDRLSPRYFDKSTKLFAWLEATAEVEWTDRELLVDNGGKVKGVNEAKAFEGLAMQIPSEYRYDAVETIPHVPPIESAYYFPRDLPESDGSALAELMALFNPETEADRQLIEALILTGMWGGAPGKRPAFVITTDHGRGAGKSSTAQAIGRIFGGVIGIRADEGWDKLQSRLLDPSTATKRFCMIDNLKNRLSSAEFEAMITERVINGKRMYVGDGERVNRLTWIFTANTPTLSNDLASRSVVIKIGEADHSLDFEAEIDRILEDKGDLLLADIKARLEEPPRGRVTDSFDRWQAWQRAVLSRFENAEELAGLIQDRRGEVDDDASLSGIWADALREKIAEKGHKPAHVKTVVPSSTLVEIAKEVEHDRTIGYRQMWDTLRDILGVGDLKGCRRKKGTPRGLIWVGKRVSVDETYTDYNTPDDPPQVEHLEDRKKPEEDIF